ncbi:MAG: hypothetical protein L0H81_04860 [Actinomyces sp.]|nr:hypothetical protein [Actinomyces sp.]MDN6795315.1 hypothetical protein [Propionibacterium sp.]
MFGINGAEFLVILLVAALVVGPEGVVQALRTFKSVIATLKGWSARLREETRHDMSDVTLPGIDWSNIDLREYDPREMVRQAVREEMEEWMKAGSPGNHTAAPPQSPSAPVTPPVSQSHDDTRGHAH